MSEEKPTRVFFTQRDIERILEKHIRENNMVRETNTASFTSEVRWTQGGNFHGISVRGRKQ